ncbi:MAG: flagellar hook-basal body protein [Candidatus Omnitrophica bacterium]|nr:flagellar hook-basal body protein [Candidatus Omnitrophota bacterium]
MLRGIYISSSGMSSQMIRQDVIANNMANVDTPGFKKDNLLISSFPRFLVNRLDDEQDRGTNPYIGSFSLGSIPIGTVTDFSTGGIISTHRPLDLAIEGRGFFVLETPQGIRYTRAGSFLLSSEGKIVTFQGYALMGENGPLEVNGEEFYFNSQGELIVGGNIVNKLLIVDIDNKNLVKEKETIFSVLPEAVISPSLDYNVRQGYLETSNVNIVKEMIEMISGLRAYEANQKVLTMQDESLGKLINESIRG